MGFGDLFRSGRSSHRPHRSAAPQEQQWPPPRQDLASIRPWTSGDRRMEFIDINQISPPPRHREPEPRPSYSRPVAQPSYYPPQPYYTPSRSSSRRPVSPLSRDEMSRSYSRRDRSPVSPMGSPYPNYSRRREPAASSSSYGRNPYEMPDFSRSPRRDYEDLGMMDSGRRGPSRRHESPSRSSNRRGASPEPSGYGGVDLSSLGGGYNPYAGSYGGGYGGGYGYSTREYRPPGR